MLKSIELQTKEYDKRYGIIEEYYGTHEAERMTGIRCTNISSCCLGKLKTAGGYIWKYVIKRD